MLSKRELKRVDLAYKKSRAKKSLSKKEINLVLRFFIGLTELQCVSLPHCKITNNGDLFGGAMEIAKKIINRPVMAINYQEREFLTFFVEEFADSLI